MNKLIWWGCCVFAWVKWQLHLVKPRVHAAGWLYEAVCAYSRFVSHEESERKMNEFFSSEPTEAEKRILYLERELYALQEEKLRASDYWMLQYQRVQHMLDSLMESRMKIEAGRPPPPIIVVTTEEEAERIRSKFKLKEGPTT